MVARITAGELVERRCRTRRCQGFSVEVSRRLRHSSRAMIGPDLRGLGSADEEKVGRAARCTVDEDKCVGVRDLTDESTFWVERRRVSSELGDRIERFLSCTVVGWPCYGRSLLQVES